MTRRIQVTYENGVLVPQEKINFPEHQCITITLDEAFPDDPMPAGGVELVDWQARHRVQMDAKLAEKIIHSKAYEYYEEADES